MRKILALLVTVAALTCGPVGAAIAEEAAWTIVLHPADFVIGAPLVQLHTRHTWAAEFDARWGGFEIAVRKKAVAIPAPQCRMDYLILKIPFYYPENPKQASVGERRKVYDALVALQASGTGTLTARVDAPEGLSRTVGSRVELTACNLYFALPLSVQVSTH
jgi:hypothetical protein